MQLKPNQQIIFKFSNEFQLEYVNDFFTEFTGYEIHDVIGNNVEAMNHPDIPKLISNMISKSVKNKKNINLILKNTTKDGRFYWFQTNFLFETDKKNNLISFKYIRSFPSRFAIPILEKLYKKLLDIENHASIEVAEKYLAGFLEEKNMSLPEYTAHISKVDTLNTMFHPIEKVAKKKSWFRR